MKKDIEVAETLRKIGLSINKTNEIIHMIKKKELIEIYKELGVLNVKRVEKLGVMIKVIKVMV